MAPPPAPLLRRLWRLLPLAARQRAYERSAAMLAASIDRAPPPARAGIAIAGEIDQPTGLGESARLMQRVLAQAGIATWQINTRGRSGTAADMPPLPPGIPLIVHINPPHLSWVMRRLPRHLTRGRRLVGYWAWELTAPPPAWRDALRFVHEIWVPSHFTAAALAGLLPPHHALPLRVVPHPLAAAPPLRAPLDRAAFGLPEHAFVVIVAVNFASSALRKNPLGAITAFRQAFGDRADRLLLLKLGDTQAYPAAFAAVRAAVADAANIMIETRPLPQADNAALIAAADVVLSLHRSEGFGLVMAEAMLLGVPVVATGWSGNMDFMDATTAALVGWRLVAPRDPSGVFNIPGAVWAEPDVDEAAYHLRRLADDRMACRALGARGRAMALQRLGSAPLLDAVRGLGLDIQAGYRDAESLRV